MMKKFLVVLSVLFFAVSVSAADLNLSGSYNFKGINADFSKVYDVTEVPTAVHEASEYYEMDFDLTAKIVVNDKISITTVMEMVDRHLGQHVAGGQDIEVKRSYLTAKITDALTLDFGRMAGGTWATAFGDTEDHYDRIKAVYVTPVGVLLAVMEKNIENSTGWGTAQPEKTEEKDMDSLALGFITKAGPVNIKPLYKMVTNAGAAAAVPHDTDLAAMVLGVDGDFGMVAFEAEYISKTYSGDVEASVTGMFANVWYKADALKAGFLYADGTYDDAVGFTMGEDWNFGTLAYYLTNGQLTGYNVMNLYVEYTVNEKLSVDFCYVMGSHNKENIDAAYSEMDFNLAYVLTDALTASVGYATGSVDPTGSDSVSASKMYWGMKAAF